MSVIATFFSMQVAILNGITMGGGAGISIPGTFRLPTYKTVCIWIQLCVIAFPVLCNYGRFSCQANIEGGLGLKSRYAY